MASDPTISGYRIYHGLGGPDSVDYATPIAFIPVAEAEGFTVPLELAAGTSHTLAARAVQEGGTEEHNTHVTLQVTLDDQGRLVAGTLPVPYDLAAQWYSDGSLAAGFRCQAEASAPLTALEILTDGGSGIIDTEHPIAVIAMPSPDRDTFAVHLAAPAVAALMAVRAVRFFAASEPSVPVYVPARPACPLPIFL